MKTSKTFQNKQTSMRIRGVVQAGLTAMAVVFISANWGTSICLAQENDNDAQGTEVLTRGPVHEAFAGIVTYNPVPGVLVQKAPPEAIEEIPPGERPEGDNITWIPGYWAWDDERNDYLWVSGTWRALPPGRQWVAGYWGNTTLGNQWTSGYWADASQQETTYLPAPPATLEDGPSTKAPSRDYGWTPGNWAWRQERYAWSPGYWAQGRSDWDWVPAHYVWTRRGYIYVDGYWDYSVRRRGTLFAPVYFNSGVYSRQGYSYSPSIVLDVAMFVEHLFLRPNYHHYYFGDYYAPRYNQGGIYAAYSYQTNRHGYDPIYSHQRWSHREDQGWDRRAQDSFRYRSEHENARPPHTWAAMRKIDANTAESKQNSMVVAAPIDQLAKRKDGPVRFQPVAKADREMIAQRGQAMRKTSSERRSLETNSEASTPVQKPGEVAKTTKVKLPKSPIVAKSVSQFDKSQAPPEAQRSPKTESLDQTPKPEKSDRQTKGDTNNPPPDVRKPGIEKIPMPKKTDEAPRETQIQPDRPKKGGEKQVQPTTEERVKETPAKVQEQPSKRQETPDRSPKKAEMKEPPAPERRVKEAPTKVQEQPTRRQETPDQSPKKAEVKEPPAPERRVRETPEKVKEQPTRKEPENSPQREARPNTKEKSPTDPRETEQPGKKDRKKES